MRGDPPLPVSQDKSPRERFVELGTKIMSVPKSELDARDKRWHSRKKSRGHKRREK